VAQALGVDERLQVFNYFGRLIHCKSERVACEPMGGCLLKGKSEP
jgi:hypothetical protein